MAGNCNSNPSNGCQDSQTYIELSTLTDLLDVKIDAILEVQAEIIASASACCTTNNAKLEDIIDLFQQIINANEDCCEETLGNINAIIESLADKLNVPVPTTTTTTTTVIPGTTTTTTTSIPSSTTTTTTSTTLPVTTTTTTIAAGLQTGIFFVVAGSGSEEQFPCDEYSGDQMTLYYVGAFGTGTTMYTNAGLTNILTGYDFIKAYGSLSVYDINSESGVVGSVTYTCA